MAFQFLWKRKHHYYLIFLSVAVLICLALRHPNPSQEPTFNPPPPAVDDDKDCPFRDSPLYRSIFVYPNPHTEARWFEKLRSSYNTTTIIEWPWIRQRETIRKDASFLYNIDQPSLSQFSLDLIVYEILTSSCLRTWNAEVAQLFFVPFLPSVFRRGGLSHDNNEHTSIYEEALAQAMAGQSFEGWERVFGLTSHYWKRRQGTDHIVVMPEPLHGLYHPKGKRGFHHYIKTQKQLLAPIVISVEVSRTFVETYPQCSQKNILVPYPNIDGRWYNGHWEETTNHLLQQHGQKERPMLTYYDAGNHGECLALRKALKSNHECESELPNRLLPNAGSRNNSFPIGMRMATFCPCPAGDSPSAKRMFDAVLAGCIPVILSQDFVWPFSANLPDFALHLNAADFSTELYQRTADSNPVCQRTATSGESLNEYLRRTISTDQIAKLQEGLKKAAMAYSYFERSEKGSQNPLREGVVPSGGAALHLVEELTHRVTTGMGQWRECEEEKAKVLQQTGGKMVKENKC